MATTRILIDHHAIRQWAEQHGARPTCVRHSRGEGATGILRLGIPGLIGEGTLEPISWDEWLEAFDDDELALVVQDGNSFNRLISRPT